MSGPVLVFDSGVGGLSVLRHIRAQLPDADLLYVADHAGFPYGPRDALELVTHIAALMERLIAAYDPSAVVIACNTASTLVLPPLRSRFAIPFVGTVPAIKPAAARTRSGLVSVLATPGTVRRDYTFDLIRDFAPEVAITLVGAGGLAALAEGVLAGEIISEDALAAEIAPCFVDRDGERTDTVVLACTHFPFLLDHLEALAPWPVQWIDPAPAIARRVVDVVGSLATGHVIGHNEAAAPQRGSIRYLSTRPPARFPQAYDPKGHWEPAFAG